MASSTNQLTIVLGIADAKLRAGVKRAQAHLKGLDRGLNQSGAAGTRAGNQIAAGATKAAVSLNTARKSVARFSEAVRSTIVNMRFLATAFVGGALTRGIVKFSSSFEKSLAEINTLLVDTEVKVETFSASLKGLAATTPKDLLDLSSALYQIISAGVPAADAMNVLSQSTKLAVSSLSETRQAADLLITTLNAYKNTGLDAGDATDKLTQIYTQGRTTIGKMSAAMGRAAPIAAQFGVTLDELGGLLISLTRAGLNTNESMTAIRALMSGLAKPTKKTRKLLKELNIAFGQGAISAAGFSGVLEQLLAATGGNVEVLARLFPNIRALLPAVVTVGANFEEFKGHVDGVANSFGRTDEALAKTDDKFFKSAALLKSNFQNVLVKMGDKIMPNLQVKLDQLSAFFQSESGGQFAETLASMLSGFIELTDVVVRAIGAGLTPLVNALESSSEILSTIVKTFVILKLAAYASARAVVVSTTAMAAYSAGTARAALMSGTYTAALALQGKTAATAAAASGTAAATMTAASFKAAGGSMAAVFAAGLSTALTGALRILGGIGIFVFVAHAIWDSFFGESERIVEEKKRKYQAEMDKERKRVEALIAKLNKERLGATPEQIEKKESRVETGTTFKITNDQKKDLIARGVFQEAELIKQADRLLEADVIMEKFFAAEAKRLGDAAKTEKGLLDVRKGALADFTGFVGEELNRLEQIEMGGLSGLSVALERMLKGAEGEELKRLAKLFSKDLNFLREEQVTQLRSFAERLSDLREGAVKEALQAYQNIEDAQKSLNTEDSIAELAKQKTALDSFLSAVRSGQFESLDRREQSFRFLDRVSKSLTESAEYFDDIGGLKLLGPKLADFEQSVSKLKSAKDSAKAIDLLVESFNSLRAQGDARGAFKIAAQIQAIVKASSLPIRDTSTRNALNSAKRYAGLLGKLRRETAKLTSQEKLLGSERKKGRRGRNYQLAFEKALAKLKDKTVRQEIKNTLSLAKLRIAQAKDQGAIVEENITRLKKENEFYGRQSGLVDNIIGLLSKKKATLESLIVAEKESLKATQASSKAELDRAVKAERLRLNSLIKGNAAGRRRADNVKKMEAAVNEFRIKKSAEADQKIEKERIKTTTNIRKANQKILELQQRELNAHLDESRGMIKKLESDLSSLTASISRAQTSMSESVGIKSTVDSLALINKMRARELELLSAKGEELAIQAEYLDRDPKSKQSEIDALVRQMSAINEQIRLGVKAVSASSEIQNALGDARPARDMSAVYGEIEQKIKAAEKNAQQFEGIISGLPLHSRMMLQEIEQIPSELIKINKLASKGIFSDEGGLVTSLNQAAKFIADIFSGPTVSMGKDEAIAMRDTFVAGSKLIAQEFVRAPLSLLRAADEFTLRVSGGLRGISAGDFVFLTDAAMVFASQASGFLVRSVDVVGSIFGTTIGKAIGDFGGEAGEEIGGKAGTAFGLVVSSILSGALRAVSSYVVSPIQAAVSTPFEMLSSGIGSAFSMLSKEGTLSQEAFNKRISIMEKEHALRLEQIEKEADASAKLIDADLGKTKDINKIKELTAKREQVRADRDKKLLEERRKQFSKVQKAEDKAKSDDPIQAIDKHIQSSLRVVEILIEKLPSLAVHAVSKITESLPAIIVGAAQALGSTLSAIAPLMGDMIKSIVGALIESLPFLLKGAAEFAVGLFEGILEGFVEILSNFDAVIGPFIDALVSSVPQIVGAFIANLPAIIGSIIKMLPLVVAQLVSGLGRMLVDIFARAGNELLNIISFGLAGGEGKTATGGLIGGALAGGTAATAIGLAQMGGLIGGTLSGPVGWGIIGGAALLGGIGGALDWWHSGGNIKDGNRHPVGARLLAGLGARGFATGGMVDGIQNSINGSRLRALRRGVDDVPAVLQAGEAVLNRRAVMNLGEDTITALNGGSSLGAEPSSINVSINPDERGLSRVVEQILPYLIGGVNAEVGRPGSQARINSMKVGNRPMGTMRPRRG